MKESKPFIIIVCGFLGVGKTTVANMLGGKINTPVISIDEIIHKIFPNPSNENIDKPFSAEEIRINYQVFGILSEYMLNSRNSLILDGSFAKAEQRSLIKKIANKFESPVYFIHVVAPDNLVRERASQRFEEKKGVGWQAHLDYKNEFEELTDEVFEIDTSKSIEPQISEFIQLKLN